MNRSLIVLAALAIAGPAAAETESFKDWTVVCDNVRTCTAFGFSPEGDEDIAYLRIERSGAAAARPQVRLAAHGDGLRAWRAVEVDGKPVAGVGPLTAKEDADSGLQSVSLTGPQGEALLTAIGNGASLSLRDTGKAVQISLSGSAAALRWMDDRQKRAGTVTALLARGGKPASAVPAPPLAPLARAAAPVSQAGLPKKPPASLAKPGEDCEDDIDPTIFQPEVARLAPGLVVWGIVCGHGAYNVIYSLYLADEAGRSVRPLSLVYEPGGKPFSDPMNIALDPKTQTLSNFDRARGIGDCGAMADWVWDGKAFQPTHKTLMPECRGVLWSDWPADYVTRAK